MTMKPYYLRNMLLQYDRQLVTARRLARYNRSMGRGVTSEDPAAREAKRHALVERVAREIVENLLMSGSNSPIVEQIREELEKAFDASLLFEYPIEQPDLHIFKQTSSGPKEVTSQERMQIMNTLWQLTLDKVNETML